MKMQQPRPYSPTGNKPRARRQSPFRPAEAPFRAEEERARRPSGRRRDAEAPSFRREEAPRFSSFREERAPFYPPSACKPLFPGMDSFARKGMNVLFRILDGIMPLSSAHKREMPMACRELSALLTTDRADLARPYWTTPRLTSAYLRYFLPWNLVRLLPLLPALPLELPELKEGERALIVDLGSGPFTLPLALWLGRPDLRSAPVTLVCADTAPHPLNLGKDIFEALRKELDPSSPWEVHLLRTPLGKTLHSLRGRPWLISAGNVLNELEDKSRRPGAWQEKVAEFADEAARILLPGGYLFALEPGTRQGAKMIRALREAAIFGEGLDDAWLDEEDDELSDEFGAESFDEEEEEQEEEEAEEEMPEDAPRLVPLAPCTHCGHCPMDRPGTSAWCHVNAPADDAPAQLRALSQKAGLDKISVSLSFLLLHKEEQKAEEKKLRRGRLEARLLSEPFVLPDYPGRARYACTSRGLALIPNCAMLPPGALCHVEDLPRPLKDRKSGALILPLARPEGEGREGREEAPRGRREDFREGRRDSRYGERRERDTADRRSDTRDSRREERYPREDRGEKRRPYRGEAEGRSFREDREPRGRRDDHSSFRRERGGRREERSFSREEGREKSRS